MRKHLTKESKLISLLAILTSIFILSPSTAAEENGIRVLVVPHQEAKLSSQMNGFISAFKVDNGDRFKQGDILVEFECAEQQAQLDVSQSNATIAEKTHDAQLQLKALSAVSDLEVQIASAEVDKTKAMLRNDKIAVARCHILAPFSGKVVKRLANSFENVAYGTELLDIIDDKKLKLELFSPSNWLGWMKAGKTFSIRIDENGLDYQAVVKKISAKVDAESQTIAVWAEIGGSQKGLLAGMSGVAHFDQVQ